MSFVYVYHMFLYLYLHLIFFKNKQITQKKHASENCNIHVSPYTWIWFQWLFLEIISIAYMIWEGDQFLGYIN